jgi:hypothetical protein
MAIIAVVTFVAFSSRLRDIRIEKKGLLPDVTLKAAMSPKNQSLLARSLLTFPVCLL